MREYLDALIVAGLVGALLITFVIRTFYIPSVSMVPTLQVRDVLLVDESPIACTRRSTATSRSSRRRSVARRRVRQARHRHARRHHCASPTVSSIATAPRSRTLREPAAEIRSARSSATASTSTARPLDPREANVPPRSRGKPPTAFPTASTSCSATTGTTPTTRTSGVSRKPSGTFAAGPLATRTRAPVSPAALSRFSGRSTARDPAGRSDDALRTARHRRRHRRRARRALAAPGRRRIERPQHGASRASFSTRSSSPASPRGC